MATLAMAAVLVLSQARRDSIAQSDGPALRAVANAALAALQAEILRSEAQHGRALAKSSKLRKIVGAHARSPVRAALPRRFRDLAYQGPLAEHQELSVALVDPWGEVIAEAGLASQALKRLAKNTRRQEKSKALLQPTPVLTMLDGRPLVFSIHPIEGSDLRLLGVAKLHAHGDGLVRRVLGSSYPAAIFSPEHLVLELAEATTLNALSREITTSGAHSTRGMSEATFVGKGVDRRLAVSGLIDSNYLFGKDPLSLVVLSPTNAGYQRHGILEQLSIAWGHFDQGRRGFLLLFALWLTSVGISVVLPRMEWSLPLSRLGAALEELQQRGSSEILQQSEWNRHFEALVTTLSRGPHGSATNRSWKLSTSRRALRSSKQISAPVSQRSTAGQGALPEDSGLPENVQPSAAEERPPSQTAA